MTRHLAPPTRVVPATVILATDSTDPSGVGHHMIALARHLDPGLRPVLGFAESPHAAHFVACAAAAGLTAQPVSDWPAWIVRQGAALLHVHAGIGWEGQALAATGRAAGLPVLRTEHLPWLITDPGQRQDYATALRHVDGLVAVSGTAGASWQAALAGMIAPPLRVVPNGIAAPRPATAREAVRQALGLAPADMLVLHVGRFMPQKAQEVLVAAFALLPDDLSARLLMIGDGETRAAVAAQATGLPVTFLDAREDLPCVMRAADLFVLPSRFEGLPLVLLEAMALGLPVVATRICGIVDALGADHPGLVPPDDAPALATAMAARLSDPARAAREGRELQVRASRFTAQRMAEGVAAIYRQTLRRKERAPMTTPTRVGFVGTGGIARRHLGVLADFADVRVTAVTDPDRASAEEIAAPLGARVDGDVQAMLGQGDIDALFICVPPFAHGPAERAALAAGVPFFVEKPVSLDLALAEEIAAGIAAKGLVTAVGYHWRYLDTLDTARRALAANPAQLIVGHWLDSTPPPGWWGRQDQSGGQFVEQVTHLIDAARVLAGAVTRVYAQGNHKARERFPALDVPTAGTATLTFEGGAVANLSATCLLDWNHRTGLHVFADALAIELSDRDVMVDTGRGRHPEGAEGDPVWRQDRDFIDAVRGKPDRIRTPYAEAVETHRVALAVAESMSTGAVVTLPGTAPAPLPPPGHLRPQPARPQDHRRVRSLGVEAPGRAYFFDYHEGPAGDGQVRLDLMYTGLSAGTELTILKGTNPYLHARWDAEAGVFRDGEPTMRYPVPFMGYMECARVIDSRAEGFAVGQVVGTTFGHKTGHTADPRHDLLVPLPDGMDPLLGIFAAQMGPIAANGILHADALERADRFGGGIAGRRAVVWGGGTVGLLTALFARAAGATVTLAEPSAFRRSIADRLGLHATAEDEAWQAAKSDGGADVVFQTRARADSLHLCLRALRPQGAVIDLAFYQGGLCDLRLGEEFHHNGLSIHCAQIGRVPRGMAEAWPRARLSAETLRLLSAEGERVRDAMVTHVIPLSEAPAFLTYLVEDRPEFLQVVFTHAS